MRLSESLHVRFELGLLAQGAMSQLKQVADDKVATKDVINQKDAAKIASAEAKLNDGQVPANSVSSKAQVCAQTYSTLTLRY